MKRGKRCRRGSGNFGEASGGKECFPLKHSARDHFPSRIALVAPAGIVDEVRLKRGLRNLERVFPEVEFLRGANLSRRLGYFSAGDSERLRELKWAFEESEADVVWAARGGFGCARLLERISEKLWRRWADSGKILAGFSDITALLVRFAQFGGRAIHSPMPAADLGEHPSRRMLLHLRDLLQGRRPLPISFRNPFSLQKHPRELNISRGRLSAGNLVVFASLCGTPFQPEGTGRVIFLEEVNEEPYRVDRLLTQLRCAGFFRGARAVVFGTMRGCVPESPARSFTITETLKRFARDSGCRVLKGFPFGHGRCNLALPLNERVEIVEQGPMVTVKILGV